MAKDLITLDEVVAAVEREVSPKIMEKARAEFGPNATTLDAINQRVEELSANVRAQKESFDEGVLSLTARIQRSNSAREQLSGDRLRVSPDGRIEYRISDGLAAAINAAMRTKLTPSLENDFRKRSLDLLTGGLTTAGENATIIPVEYMDEFMSLQKRFGQYQELARPMPMSAKEQAFPAFDGDGTDAQWVPESGQPTAQTLPDFKDVTMTNEILMALAAIPITYLEDARPNVQQIVSEHFARRSAYAIDKAGFLGTGAGISTQQPFVGILNDPGVAVVPLKTGSAFTDLTFDDIAGLQDAVEDEALEGAAYHFNRTFINFLRTLKDKNGRFIYAEPSMTEPAQLFNYPVRKIRVLPKVSASAANTPFGFFGNMNYTLFGDRSALQIGFNENPLWANMKVLGRSYQRTGIKVGIPEGFAVIKTNA